METERTDDRNNERTKIKETKRNTYETRARHERNNEHREQKPMTKCKHKRKKDTKRKK